GSQGTAMVRVPDGPSASGGEVSSVPAVVVVSPPPVVVAVVAGASSPAADVSVGSSASPQAAITIITATSSAARRHGRDLVPRGSPATRDSGVGPAFLICFPIGSCPSSGRFPYGRKKTSRNGSAGADLGWDAPPEPTSRGLPGRRPPGRRGTGPAEAGPVPAWLRTPLGRRDCRHRRRPRT